MTLQQIDPQASAPTAWDEYGARDRILLVLGALACILLFYAASRQIAIPARPGFSASLLQQPNPGMATIVTILVFFAALFVGATFTSRVHRDGGLFCACIGLAVLSGRGGPMRHVLFEASGPSVYLMLAGEMILLGAMLAAAWLALDRFVGPSKRDHDSPGKVGDQKYLATSMQILLMIALMTLLAQSDTKGQALAAVGFSAMLATMAANWFAPASPSPWLWCGPILVGLLGYVAGYFSPGGMEIGRTSGYFAPLARPLPLDYASLGVAGSLMGYWISSRWHHAAAAQLDKPISPEAS